MEYGKEGLAAKAGLRMAVGAEAPIARPGSVPSMLGFA